MRTLLIASLVAAAVGAAACGSSSDDTSSGSASGAASTAGRHDRRRGLRQGGPAAQELRHADRRDRQARLPAVLRGRRPDQRQGLRERRRLRDRRPARLHRGRGEVDDVPFNSSYAPGPKKFDFDVNQISITPKRARARRLLDAVLHGAAGGGRAQGLAGAASATSLADLADAKLGVQVGTTSLDAVNEVDQAEHAAAGLQRLQRRRARAEERAGRRDRRRPADRLLPHRRARSRRRRSSASSRRPAATTGALLLEKGSPLTAVRQPGGRPSCKRLGRAAADHRPLDRRRGGRARRSASAASASAVRAPRSPARRPAPPRAPRHGDRRGLDRRRRRRPRALDRHEPGLADVSDTFFSWRRLQGRRSRRC